MPEIRALEADVAEGAETLGLAVGRITRRLRQGHTVGDLTPSEASVLSRLNRDGPDSPGMLAELERVRPQAMASTLAALEERGLVCRQRHAEDGRRAVMTVTPTGCAVLAARRSESLRRLTTVLEEEFSPAERRRLLAALPLLDRLAERL
jgi:DNA-binding MarR family transcriptional regulator